MRRFSFLVLVLGLILTTVPALAGGVPASGTVFEGTAVPGVALGDTRADVIAAYGPPSYCQSVTAGDFAYCTYNVSGLGSVSVRYEGAAGGNAANSPDDVVSYVRWSGFPDWVTTAGISHPIASADPAAVIAAYPDSDVTYTPTGEVFQVRDNANGIEVTWQPNPYNGTVTVSLLIFPGLTPTAVTLQTVAIAAQPTAVPYGLILALALLTLATARRARISHRERPGNCAAHHDRLSPLSS